MMLYFVPNLGHCTSLNQSEPLPSTVTIKPDHKQLKMHSATKQENQKFTNRTKSSSKTETKGGNLFLPMLFMTLVHSIPKCDQASQCQMQ